VWAKGGEKFHEEVEERMPVQKFVPREEQDEDLGR
jgi:hypothetical protein